MGIPIEGIKYKNYKTATLTLSVLGGQAGKIDSDRPTDLFGLSSTYPNKSFFLKNLTISITRHNCITRALVDFFLSPIPALEFFPFQCGPAIK